MPRELAARPRFPDERFTAPTMYFFSNSFLARSREMPCARSSSMISWSCPSRFTCPPPKNPIRNGRGAHLSKGQVPVVVRVNLCRPDARENFHARGRRQKKEEAPSASPNFFGGWEGTVYFTSHWSPTSISRLESITRAAAQRSPT